MEFDVKCPNCTGSLTVDSSMAGDQIKCPGCSTVLVVQTADAAAWG